MNQKKPLAQEKEEEKWEERSTEGNEKSRDTILSANEKYVFFSNNLS